MLELECYNWNVGIGML